jgi:hypothetical protein
MKELSPGHTHFVSENTSSGQALPNLLSLLDNCLNYAWIMLTYELGHVPQ